MFLLDFGMENGSNLAPKSIEDRCQLRTRTFLELRVVFGKTNSLMGLGLKLGVTIDQKSRRK